jgi:hypothetical protein
VELVGKASVDLEEGGVKVYKVVAVEVIWRATAKSHELLDLRA